MGCMSGCVDGFDEEFSVVCINGWSVSCDTGYSVGYVDDCNKGFPVVCTVVCSVA